MADIDFGVNSDGVAIITWNMAGRSTNVINPESFAEFRRVVERTLADDAIRSAVVASGKASFIVGADLDWLERLAEGATDGSGASARALYAEIMEIQTLFRRIETGGKPLIAAINGSALGGGFELCLACHRRVVADDARIQLGLPEAKVGLMPGGGGTQRLARMLGATTALPILLEGRIMTPQACLAQGLVDALAPPSELLQDAVRWASRVTHETATKPWDERGFVLPGPDPRTLVGSQAFAAANARQRKRTLGNYPALDAIQRAVYDGLFVPMDAALRIETRYFVKTVLSASARSMIRTQFTSVQQARKLARRPSGIATRSYERVGVLGAGMMGSGIANACAKAGLEVVLIDVDRAAAEGGRRHVERFHEAAVRAGQMSRGELNAILARIRPMVDYAELARAGLVIEAVFEDRAVKAEVTRRAEAALPPDAIFATNTSTLPISGLAEASSRPDRFIGLHFFSPVERMQLVEAIRGRKTSDATLAGALDFIKRIGRTPIVVNDSRGFFTSRVFATFTTEGLLMLAEGIDAALIENAGRATGMPVPPLALCDEVSIGLIHQVNVATQRDLGAQYIETPATRMVATMVGLGRLGKKAAKGFYEYADKRRLGLWPGLRDLVPPVATPPSLTDLRARLLNVQAIEAARCLEDLVIASPADADVGATLGWGFAPWTGGPLSYVDAVGATQFVGDCERLAQRYGSRFDPPALLRSMAQSHASFYPQHR